MVKRSAILKYVMFIAVFVAVVAFSLANAAWLKIHEAGTILLFIPLLWSFISLRPAGMIVTGILISIARVAVELLGIWNNRQVWDLPHAFEESVWPIGLYVALGIVLYVYRKRQATLVSSLVNAGTAEARHRIASSLTHDFNNILAVIIGTGDLLLRSPDLTASHRADVESIVKAGREGASLIDQFRRASRGGEKNPVSVEFGNLIENQTDLVMRMLPPNIHVVRHSGGELPVKADKGQILRALMNLCLNARDAMPKGGILTIQTERRSIHGIDCACLTVSDTGPGVDPAVKDRIFEPFFTTREAGGGVGLGLSIVKSVATSHGGSVEVHNIPGSGASFTFAIPLETSSDVAKPQPYRRQEE